MRVQSRSYCLMGRYNVEKFDFWLSFSDYDKIFQYLHWRIPVDYRPYGTYMKGIVATYADGTEERMSWLQMRDLLENNWLHLKRILQEDDGPNLNHYTQHGSYYHSLGHETPNVDDRGNITFQTHQAGCCSMNFNFGNML